MSIYITNPRFVRVQHLIEVLPIGTNIILYHIRITYVPNIQPHKHNHNIGIDVSIKLKFVEMSVHIYAY